MDPLYPTQLSLFFGAAARTDAGQGGDFFSRDEKRGLGRKGCGWGETRNGPAMSSMTVSL